MRKLTTLLSLAIAFSALSLGAAAPKDDVLAAIRNYRQSLIKKDVAALEKIWTDDYVFINGH
ncbi:MAG TPA: hypothetical protein VN605_06085, partial [Thermoanaerobaculia bacterium]|nr:hypothetical protein [Thermoanaerobaculia bacterium]